MSQGSGPVVFVVDADPSIRESLEHLIRKAGWQFEAFASPPEFLARSRNSIPSCLVADVMFPSLAGLALQRQINCERCALPIIFLSSHSDIATTVTAMKSGALDFLAKPINHDLLIDAIRNGIKRSELVLGRESELYQIRSGYGSLTPREREVMTLVASGLPNKVVGGELGISEITVKMHRGNVMRKMRADSFAQLVNMASRLRVARPQMAVSVSA
jgi:FixJ family two-component response regulator